MYQKLFSIRSGCWQFCFDNILIRYQIIQHWLRFILTWKDVAVAMPWYGKLTWVSVMDQISGISRRMYLRQIRQGISSDEKWFWNVDNQNKFLFIFYHLFGMQDDFLKWIVKIEYSSNEKLYFVRDTYMDWGLDWGYVVYNSMWYATWQKVSCDKGLTFELNIFPYWYIVIFSEIE